jgi:NifU-like protein involved in Fe-S cluster formation
MGPELRAALQAADGAGDLVGNDVGTGTAEHPVCGDLLRVQVRLAADGSLADLAWRADGCPATLAVASIARAALVGRPPAAAKERLAARLADCGGLATHERHAEGMFLRALADALTDLGASGTGDPKARTDGG